MNEQCGSNRTNNIDGAEVQFGSPTMQSSNQYASHNKRRCYVNKPPITSVPALHHGNQVLFVPN